MVRALSFFRRKYSKDLTGVDVAITGIPFDQAVSNRPGARLGPEAIRRASAPHAWGPIWPWRFDPFDTLACVDYGDCSFDWGAPMEIPAAIEAHVAGILAAGAATLNLGGDHFTTYPTLKAYAAKYGPMGMVQFDAHRDVEQDDGGRIDHGSMFYYAVRDGILDPARVGASGHPHLLSRRTDPWHDDPARRSGSGHARRGRGRRNPPRAGRRAILSDL